MARANPQDLVYETSLRTPETFWRAQAQHLHWHKQPLRALSQHQTHLPASDTTHPHWSWFPGGEISTAYNCVDRHVLAGRGDSTAVIWDSPVTGAKRRISYLELLGEVETLAGVLREEGVGRGDVVLVYMPMIPASIIALLAVSRLGAIHAVVFGGFSSASLAQRIEASTPKAIMTASCGVEGSKGPVGYQSLVRGAVEKSSFKPAKTIVWQREQLRWEPVRKEEGERNWQRLVKSARNRGVKAEAVPVGSAEGLYIIYTSGTTGLPKGVVRSAGGHAVHLNFSIRYMFGLKPNDVMFCASDIGWVVGHTYIVYAPLLAGATTVLFEGKPIGTPDASTFWRICEEYKVKTMFTAPTALRAIRREDGDNAFIKKVGERGGLRNLTALFLAGERSEPSIVSLYQRLLEQYGAPGAIVNDNWWSSESGSPISGLALNARAAEDFEAVADLKRDPPLAIKPGSAGKPMPGFDVRIVDDEGKEVEKGSMGNIVLGIPLGPSALTTLWKDEERFYKGYMKRFEGRWIDTGDAGMIDADGYVHVMSRSDDIINVAAHRFSTGAIEQAITSHPDVAEACVVGIPDALKGHLPFAFVTLSLHEHPGPAVPDSKLFGEVQKAVREQIGSIASLGGMMQGKGMIPKTRSGKTLRRVLRELVENAVHGDFDKEVQVPATIEDADVVGVARAKIREYFEATGADLHKATEARAKL
ncbi:acetyl-CoA synthetase-like protein [Saccharata proteae CBS 121410]|uniref:Acetyl-CoA synthetase-like protein n=1 Tax=Saccharata proteae CBS 121410 TaxID=1314787 RepID=A0A9P4HKC4_9PEZI|nr:acetyl-CoA synthetase-like protein [Saccharata proteae CBS 121410]